MNKRIISLFILDQVISVAAMAVALFWSAGRIDWWAAWAAIAVWVAWFSAMDFIIFRFQPDLMEERLKPPKGAKAWDRVIMSCLRLAQLARYIIAGLDARYGWTVDFSMAVQIAGLVGCALGYSLLGWAMATNAFFSQIVRIQSERSHTVVTAGPYRFVRHPGYVGLIGFELAMPILLGSWWSLLVSGIGAVLLVIRTALEDRTLKAELSGYQEYAQSVRYRLAPYIW